MLCEVVLSASWFYIVFYDTKFTAIAMFLSLSAPRADLRYEPRWAFVFVLVFGQLIFSYYTLVFAIDAWAKNEGFA